MFGGYLLFSFFEPPLATRDSLHNELDKLQDERRYMENDLASIQIRWHTLREEKVKAANTLRDVKKADEELDRLAEEKHQLDLDEKVKSLFLLIFSYQVLLPGSEINLIILMTIQYLLPSYRS